MKPLTAAAAALVAPRSSSSAADRVKIPTACVVSCELLFLVTAYSHAHYHNALSHNTSHISAVLDDDTRAPLCAGVGVLAFISLLTLEMVRLLPRPLLRIFFAAACGTGIIATCAIRESEYRQLHRLVAVLAFGAGTLLVLLVASLSRDPLGLRAAAALTALTFLTGAAQGTHVIASEFFDASVLPSWVLGLLEIGLGQ